MPASGKHGHSVVPSSRYPDFSDPNPGSRARSATLAPPAVADDELAAALATEAELAGEAGPNSWLATHTIAPAIRVSRVVDRAPRLRSIAAVCAWAALLGVVGLAIGIRGFIGVLAGDASSWYEPAIMITGTIGIGATVAGFLTVQRVRVPWVLLGIASVALATGMIMTIAAF
jgi:hypothetical protein